MRNPKDKDKADKFPLQTKCDLKAQTMPHFTLLAKDNFTPILLRNWIALAKEHGTPAEKINEARKLLAGIEEYRRLNPTLCKTPN